MIQKKILTDKSSKLETATYAVGGASAWDQETGAQNETMAYDHNGNIKSLQRTQRKHQLNGVIASYTNETIDNLAYNYNAGNGNSLTKVEDAASNAAPGFSNGSNTTTEYRYDNDGNLTSDKNKGIDSVMYNFMGKPVRVELSGGTVITYEYDAAGNKLTMKNFQGTTLLNTTDYAGNFVYTDGTLSFFGSPEGRVVNKSGSLQYEYAIADHQGNTRVVFSSVNSTSTVTATFEGDANDDVDEFTNIDVNYASSFPSANHTPGGAGVIKMDQNYKIGPSKSLAVYPGDKVDIEVWEYHEGAGGFGTGSPSLNSMITTVAGVFGGVSGAPGESGAVYSGVDNALTTFGTGGSEGDSRPAAYLNFILFDKQYNVLDAGWQLAPATTFTKQQLKFDTKTITEPGYIFVYLSYENNSNVPVYFDDFKIAHTKTNVIQYNEYYPFGLQTSNSWTRENSKNDFLYNAASELNNTSAWYDLPFRNYDNTVLTSDVSRLAHRSPSTDRR